MYDEGKEVSSSVRLTNNDFRKLLMTPRVAPSTEPLTLPDTVRGENSMTAQTPDVNKIQKSAQRKQRKHYYAKLKKDEDDKLIELAKIYRDRAKERRDGKYQDEVEESTRNTNNYRAVAPDLKSGLDAAERRKKMIQESKYLGGDMEHTHLVKGLDFALLQKVRSEIEEKELEQELELDRLVKAKEREKKTDEIEKFNENKVTFKTTMARNLYETIMSMKSKVIKRNELFAPGRMAYVVDLDDDYNTGDIPTTLIRSKADIPGLDVACTLTTNDIVINKLTQILAYLRHGIKSGKKSKKNKEGQMYSDRFGNSIMPKMMKSESIYDDIEDYIPSSTKTEASHSKFGKKKDSYFNEPVEQVFEKENAPCMSNISDLAAVATNKKKITSGMQLEPETESYAECYPGLEEMNDTLYDSDEEVDYTKMDNGKNKRLLNRWDFDTTEEYSEYMGQQEALPKAAFQYGVKMTDGRRTQRSNNKSNDKAVFDREWQKIQNIISKRKANSSGAKFESKVPRNNYD